MMNEKSNQNERCLRDHGVSSDKFICEQRSMIGCETDEGNRTRF